MNRIYQGRVYGAEVLRGKDAEGKEQWNLFGFTREKSEQLAEINRKLTKRLQQNGKPNWR